MLLHSRTLQSGPKSWDSRFPSFIILVSVICHFSVRVHNQLPLVHHFLVPTSLSRHESHRGSVDRASELSRPQGTLNRDVPLSIDPTDECDQRQKRPCDACRRRKICCVRESETEPCSLCQMRSQQCTYLSRPNVRRRRGGSGGKSQGGQESVSPEQPGFSPGDEMVDVQEESVIRARNLPESWISQFVGLSGDQDPYVLRHCHFDDDDQYNSHSWSYLRVKSGLGEAPAHFTVWRLASSSQTPYQQD